MQTEPQQKSADSAQGEPAPTRTDQTACLKKMGTVDSYRLWRDELNFSNYPLFMGTVSKDVFPPACELEGLAPGRLMDRQVHSGTAESLLVTILPGTEIF